MTHSSYEQGRIKSACLFRSPPVSSVKMTRQERRNIVLTSQTLHMRLLFVAFHREGGRKQCHTFLRPAPTTDTGWHYCTDKSDPSSVFVAVGVKIASARDLYRRQRGDQLRRLPLLIANRRVGFPVPSVSLIMWGYRTKIADLIGQLRAISPAEV